MRQDAPVQNNVATGSGSPLIVNALKEAGLAALIAFGLFGLLIGIRTDQGPTGARIFYTRFDELTLIVAAVFVGSLARSLVFGNLPNWQRITLPESLTATLRWN